jgi:DNA polymerase-3 subunit delta'
MSLGALIGNARVREALGRAVEHDRLPHALLFVGPAGVGKRAFAVELARALLCDRPSGAESCDRCPSCLRVAAGEHLDVRVFEPEGTFVKIAQMRELAREAFQTPFEGRRRILIVDDAHCLREEAANAILKTLEEPPPTTLIVLVTDQPYSMLATIRSRCRTLHFSPVDTDDLEKYLAANFKRPAEDTKLLARVAAGRVGRALATDLSVYRDRRKEMLALLEVLASGGDRLRLLKAAQFLADASKKDKSEFDDRLEIFLLLCRDLYGLTLGEPVTALANVDVTLRLQQIAASVTPERVARWVDAFDTLKMQLRQNVNRQLALEAIFLGRMKDESTS